MTTTNKTSSDIAERVARIRGLIAMTHLPPVAGADRVLRHRAIYIRDTDRSWHELEAICWTPEPDDELHGQVVTKCCDGLIPLECIEEWTMDTSPTPLDKIAKLEAKLEAIQKAMDEPPPALSAKPRPESLDSVDDLQLFDEIVRRKIVTITP
jgi:hypothetical protein